MVERAAHQHRDIRILLMECHQKMLQEMLPSTKDAYNESIKEYGELLETVVIEEIFMPLILNLLSVNREEKLLENIFGYFEEILNSDDFHLINVLSLLF